MGNLSLRTFSLLWKLFSCLVNYVELEVSLIVYRLSSHMCALCATKHAETLQKLVITLLKWQKYSLDSLTVYSDNHSLGLHCLTSQVYSGTPPCDHLVNTTTSLLRPLFFVPAKRPYISSYENPVNATTPSIRPTTTFWNPNLYNPL